MDQDIAVRKALRNVRCNISEAARETGRDPEAVELIAVSKSQPASLAQAALNAGHLHFAENRVQEAQSKWPSLKTAYPDTTLHLIGPLQTNKAAAAVSVFDVIQTLDRDKLAKNLAREMDRQNRRPQIFIQVNTGDEPQKSGVRLKDVDGFIEKCLHEYTLPIVGLMCIPPVNENLHFILLYLAKLARETVSQTLVWECRQIIRQRFVLVRRMFGWEQRYLALASSYSEDE